MISADIPSIAKSRNVISYVDIKDVLFLGSMGNAFHKVETRVFENLIMHSVMCQIIRDVGLVINLKCRDIWRKHAFTRIDIIQMYMFSSESSFLHSFVFECRASQ